MIQHRGQTLRYKYFKSIICRGVGLFIPTGLVQATARQEAVLNKFPAGV